MKANDTMKRLILLDDLQSGSSIGQYVHDTFVRKGVEVVVVNPRSSFWHKAWPALMCFSFDRNTWYQRRWQAGLFSLAAWRRNSRMCERMIRKVLRPGDRILQMETHYRPDRIYERQDCFLYVTYTMTLASRVPGTPWGPPPEEQPEFLRREGDLIRRARHVFTIADYVTQHMVDTLGADPGRMTTAGGGGDDFFLQSPPDSIPEAFSHTLLFVGWDFEYKGGRDLIAAFQKVRTVHPRLRLVVAGPDPAVVGAHPGVEAIGAVRDRNRLRQLYREADLFVMPSVLDSFGFVFIEAMSQCLPCIGTDLHAMPEIIEHGRTGYIVPRRNPDALAEAICTYYEREENRREMGQAARERALARYRWDGVVDRMMAGMWQEDS